MSITQGTPRMWTATSTRYANCGRDDFAFEDLPPDAFDGFEVDAVPLPPTPVGVTEETRRRLAVWVIRLQRGATPEDIVGEPSLEAWQVFAEDELEREEALAHADVLLSAMAPLHMLLELGGWMAVRSIP